VVSGNFDIYVFLKVRLVFKIHAKMPIHQGYGCFKSEISKFTNQQ
jgi:hypothetical protein